jgi:hypothetical protein
MAISPEGLEMAPHIKKQETVQQEYKSGHWPQMGARQEDKLADRGRNITLASRGETQFLGV